MTKKTASKERQMVERSALRAAALHLTVAVDRLKYAVVLPMSEEGPLTMANDDLKRVLRETQHHG